MRDWLDVSQIRGTRSKQRHSKGVSRVPLLRRGFHASPDVMCCCTRSGGFYARNAGKTWIPTMLLTANLFPLLCFSIASVLNTIAIAYHSLAAVPFGSIVVVLLIWMFLSFPLCLFGTVRLWASSSYSC